MLGLVTRPLCHHFPYDLRQPGRVRDHHPAAAVLRRNVRRLAGRHRPAVRGVFALPAGRRAGARRPVGSLRPPPDSDLQPRRHRRQLRHAGARAQHRHAVRRAHRRRPVGRQHLDRARLRRRRHRAEGSRAGLRPHRRGVRARVHPGAGAQRRAVGDQLHRADLGRRRTDGGRDGDGLVVAARDRASRARRAPAIRSATCRNCSGAPPSAASSPSTSSTGSRLRRSRRRSRCSSRGASGSASPKTGYFFAAFGILGAVIQGGFIRPVVKRLGDKPTFLLGLVLRHRRPDRRGAGAFRGAVRACAGAAGVRHRFRSSDDVEPGQPGRRAATSRDGCKVRPARSRVSAARSGRSGAMPRCSSTVNRRHTSQQPLFSC